MDHDVILRHPKAYQMFITLTIFLYTCIMDRYIYLTLHRNNYFRSHSAQGRAGNLGSYLVNVKSNGVNLGFLAVDATLEPGPRRPFNFVGALNQNQLVHLSGLANKGLVTYNMIDPIMSL